MALENKAEGEFSTAAELLDAQVHVWNHMFSFVKSFSLKCAIELGIPDIIHKHNKPITLSELVAALSIQQAKSHSIYRLMRLLIDSKFFVMAEAEDGEKGYWLTPSSRLLLRDEPSSVAPFALAIFEPIMMEPWNRVSEWFRSSKDDPTPFFMVHGMQLWEYAGTDQRFNQLFNGEAMASDARLVSTAMLKDCKHVFEGLKSMVDVAGGTGTVAKAIANTYPGIKCTVLDLPHVVAGLEGTHNLSYVGGDMFQSVPSADAVLLRWILNCWTDEECVKILDKCREAIGEKVIIIDMVIDEDQNKVHETQLAFDVQIMMHITGKERTEKEWAKLFFDAGFTTYKITPSLGLRSVIELFP